MVHMSCQTSFARPAPNIKWYLTDEISGREGAIQLLDFSIREQITNGTGELFCTKSELLVRVNRSFDGRYIYCLANNYPGVTSSSETILFDVTCKYFRLIKMISFTNSSRTRQYNCCCLLLLICTTYRYCISI